MTPEEYGAFPEELQVRETQTDHHILVTTLTGRRRASKDDFAQRDARRWNGELELRSIKTTMGTQVLHCPPLPPDVNPGNVKVAGLLNPRHCLRPAA